MTEELEQFELLRRWPLKRVKEAKQVRRAKVRQQSVRGGTAHAVRWNREQLRASVEE